MTCVTLLCFVFYFRSVSIFLWASFIFNSRTMWFTTGMPLEYWQYSRGWWFVVSTNERLYNFILLFMLYRFLTELFVYLLFFYFLSAVYFYLNRRFNTFFPHTLSRSFPIEIGEFPHFNMMHAICFSRYIAFNCRNMIKIETSRNPSLRNE